MRNVQAVREAVVAHELDADEDLNLDSEELRAGIRLLEGLPSTPESNRFLTALRRVERTHGDASLDLVGESFRAQFGALAVEVRSLLFRADVAGRNEGRPQLHELESYARANPREIDLVPRARVALADGLLPVAPRVAGPRTSTLRGVPRSPTSDAQAHPGLAIARSASAPSDGVEAPAAVSAAASAEQVREVTQRPPIDEVRASRRSGFEKFWFALGRGLSAFGRALHRVVVAAVDGIGVAATAAAFVIASPTLLFGIEPAELWRGLRIVTVPLFDTLGGVASGVVQWPLTAAGMSLALLRNLTSLAWARSAKGAVETLLQPVIGALLTLGQPLLFGFKELSDSLAQGRPLTDAEKSELSYDFSDDLLDSARIYEEPTWLHRLMGLIGGVGAFTVGDDVYAFYRLGPTVIRHELIHSSQYRESLGGRLGFLADYWSDLLSNALFMDVFSAYENTRAEREAYALENDPTHDHAHG